MPSAGTYSNTLMVVSAADCCAFISSSVTRTILPSTSTPLTVAALSTSAPQPEQTTLVFCLMRDRQSALWYVCRSMPSLSVAL